MEKLLAGVLEIEGEEEKFYTENYIDFYTTNDDFTAKQYARYGIQNHLIKTTFYGKHAGLQP